MDENNIVEFSGRDTVADPLTELLRKGARQLLQTAIEAELESFLKEFKEQKTPDGLAGVVRNGHHPERAVQTGIGPVTVKIPKVRSKVGKPVHDIWQAETREDANLSFDLFIESYEAKYPRAVERLMRDRGELLTFFDFPAQHWQSIRTSNPIECAFATICHRTKRTKGSLSREGMLHMMFKLGQCAEKSWRKLRGFAHLADVIEGVDFVNGIKPSNQQKAVA